MPSAFRPAALVAGRVLGPLSRRLHAGRPARRRHRRRHRHEHDLGHRQARPRQADRRRSDAVRRRSTACSAALNALRVRPGSIRRADIAKHRAAGCPLAVATQDPRLWRALPELLEKGARMRACAGSPLLDLAEATPVPTSDPPRPKCRRRSPPGRKRSARGPSQRLPHARLPACAGRRPRPACSSRVRPRRSSSPARSRSTRSARSTRTDRCRASAASSRSPGTAGAPRSTATKAVLPNGYELACARAMGPFARLVALPDTELAQLGAAERGAHQDSVPLHACCCPDSCRTRAARRRW